MTKTSPIRLGTRASALARWQANWVAEQLSARGTAVELIHITTRGDAERSESIAEIGGQGVFTKELERALLAQTIDLAVHSLKDLPTDGSDELALAAVPERESVYDVLVSRGGLPFDQLPEQAAIGTGSLRRRAQLWHARPDLLLRDIRGNVDTRLRKLADGEFDAIVLAEAGLKRLGLHERITQVFKPERILPAVGQGALGLQIRAADDRTRAALAPLDHPPSRHAVLAERALLSALAGGCLAPIGAWARVQANGQLRLDAVVLSGDGRQRLAAGAEGNPADANSLGEQVAAELLAKGASSLIDACRAPR